MLDKKEKEHIFNLYNSVRKGQKEVKEGFIDANPWLLNYRKSDTIEYEDLIAEYYDITEGIWLPE